MLLKLILEKWKQFDIGPHVLLHLCHSLVKHINPDLQALILFSKLDIVGSQIFQLMFACFSHVAVFNIMLTDLEVVS